MRRGPCSGGGLCVFGERGSDARGPRADRRARAGDALIDTAKGGVGGQWRRDSFGPRRATSATRLTAAASLFGAATPTPHRTIRRLRAAVLTTEAALRPPSL